MLPMVPKDHVLLYFLKKPYFFAFCRLTTLSCDWIFEREWFQNKCDEQNGGELILGKELDVYKLQTCLTVLKELTLEFKILPV